MAAKMIRGVVPVNANNNTGTIAINGTANKDIPSPRNKVSANRNRAEIAPAMIAMMLPIKKPVPADFSVTDRCGG